MEYFYGGGGSSNPNFMYRFEVRELTNDMWHWCEKYPLNGPFERWHVQRNQPKPIVTFESRKAAYMFSIAYSEYITKDVSYNFARSIYDDKDRLG